MEKPQTDSKGGAPKKIKVNPTPEELADLKLAAMKLWSLDIHRFVPGKDYKINLQHSKTIYNKEDVASDPLFVGVDRNKFMSVPTYKTFYDLLDNYEHEIGVAEVVTQEEIEENWRFLNAVCATPCMMYAYEYLHAKKEFQQEWKHSRNNFMICGLICIVEEKVEEMIHLDLNMFS